MTNTYDLHIAALKAGWLGGPAVNTARDLLDLNRGKTHDQTVEWAKMAVIDNARVFPRVPAAFWVDVLFFIDCEADKAIEEAEAAYAARERVS